MSWQRQFEREEDQLFLDLSNSLITQSQFNADLRDLHREYNAAAEESAQDAYDNERSQW